MIAVVLAAGVGSRLGKMTENIPKPMLKVQGKPVLEHNFDRCRSAGIKTVFINLHHCPEVISNYFGNGKGFGLNIRYFYENELLGTAGALIPMAQELVAGGPFLVMYGDNFHQYNLESIYKEHLRSGADMSVVLFELEDVSLSGVAELDKDQRILKFLEKPTASATQSRWVSAGVYVINPSVISEIKAGVSDFAKDLIPLLLNRGFHLQGIKMSTKTIGIDTSERLAVVENEILKL